MKRRVLQALAALILVVVPTALVASPAHAADLKCQFWLLGSGLSGAGDVCIRKVNNGYDAQFLDQGYSGLVDFNLVLSNGQRVGDLGAFSVSGNNSYTYFFATGYYTWAYVCLISRETPVQFTCAQSPSV